MHTPLRWEAGVLLLTRLSWRLDRVRECLMCLVSTIPAWLG